MDSRRAVKHEPQTAETLAELPPSVFRLFMYMWEILGSSGITHPSDKRLSELQAAGHAHVQEHRHTLSGSEKLLAAAAVNGRSRAALALADFIRLRNRLASGARVVASISHTANNRVASNKHLHL